MIHILESRYLSNRSQISMTDYLSIKHNNQMKYIKTILFLFISFISFSQAYIEPITFERATGILPENVDSMTLETVLGDSKFTVPHRIWSAIYSPDGKYIVIGGYNYVSCFDQQTGKRVWGRFLDLAPQYTATNPVRALSIHQETNQLMVGSDDGKVRVVDLKTGKINKVLAEDMGWIMAATISPNGRFGAATGIKGQLKMWDLKTTKEIILPKSSVSRGEAVCFSSDGQFLAVGFNNSLQIIDWDNQTATQYNTSSTVQSIVFINNDREVLISGWTGFVQRIHIKSKEVLWSKQISDWMINLRILPSQTGALAISPFYVWHLDWENDKMTNTYMPARTAMDLHPNGKTILTVGNFANRVEQFDLTTKEPINNSEFSAESPMKLTFSPDGKYLATGSYLVADKAVIWNTETWSVISSIKFNKEHGFDRFGFTKDGKYFHATMRQNNVRIPQGNQPTYYKIPTFKPVKTGIGKINADLHTAINLESMETVHLKDALPVRTAAFFGTLDDSMNRHLFGGWTIEKAYFAGVTNENMLYIYNSKTGKKVAGTPLPDFGVIACAIHPEAKVVAVTAWDGLVYIYRW